MTEYVNATVEATPTRPAAWERLQEWSGVVRCVERAAKAYLSRAKA